MKTNDLIFSNNQIMKIMHGEIDHKKDTIQKAFSNESDRKIFSLWATSHRDLIKRSDILSTIDNEVAEIEFNEIYKNSKVVSSMHLVSEKIYNVGDYLFRIIKSKNETKSWGLDEIAKKANNQYFDNKTVCFKYIQEILECFEGGLIESNKTKDVFEKIKFDKEDKDKIIDYSFKIDPVYAKVLIRKLAEQKYLSSSSALEKISPLLSRLSPQERLEILVTPPDQPLFMFLPDNTDFFDSDVLPDLVTKGLHLDSEKYISLGPDTYTHAIEKLDKFIENTTLTSSIKLDLKKKLQNNDRIEQRLLLQYISEKELQAIEKARGQDLMPIANLIKEGDWLILLRENKDNPNFSYELIAAYCEKKISLDELATAMSFDGAYSVSPEHFKIYELNEKNLETAQNMPEMKEWLELSKTIPSNLNFFVAVDSTACDTHTRTAIDSTFLSNKTTPGVFNLLDQKKNDYAMVSYGLAKAFYQQKGLTLAPILHLSPNRSSMIERVLMRFSDFALFFRNESPVIHGSSNLLFGGMHDLLHTNGRAERVNVQRAFATAARIIETKLLSQEKFGTFKTKLDKGKGKLYPSFVQEPTKTEVISYILELIAGDFVDGGYRLNIKKGIYEGDPVIKEIMRLTEVHYKRILKEYKWNLDDIPMKDIFNGVMKKIYKAKVDHYL